MKINIGSGVHPAPGWVNVDRNIIEDFQVDVVASALDLPFADGCADRAYFGHVLEHLSYEENAPKALREAWRVLRSGGELGVVGPAMDLAIETEQPQFILDAIEAGTPMEVPDGEPIGFNHQWTATVTNTWELVQSVFPNARVAVVTEVDRDSGWPNEETSLWQVAILASKP